MNPKRNLSPLFPFKGSLLHFFKRTSETPYSHQIPTLTLFPRPKRNSAMDQTKHPSVTNRSYEDFDPICKWRREESRDTLEVHLPGTFIYQHLSQVIIYFL